MSARKRPEKNPPPPVTTWPPLPTLRACRMSEMEGFLVIVLGDSGHEDPFIVETVGMHASDVGDCCGDERMANLAAAAPDLLYACREALAWIVAMGPDGPAALARHDLLSAAIAKAEA